MTSFWAWSLSLEFKPSIKHKTVEQRFLILGGNCFSHNIVLFFWHQSSTTSCENIFYRYSGFWNSGMIEIMAEVKIISKFALIYLCAYKKSMLLYLKFLKFLKSYAWENMETFYWRATSLTFKTFTILNGSIDTGLVKRYFSNFVAW